MTAIPRGRVAKVGGFHGAVIIVTAVDLRIAVIEAAPGIEVMAVYDPVLTFSLVVHRRTFDIVLAQAHARHDEDSVYLVAHDRDRRHVSEREVVEPTHGRATESAARRLCQIVVLG